MHTLVLMAEIWENQLSLVVFFPLSKRAFYMPGAAGVFPSKPPALTTNQPLKGKVASICDKLRLKLQALLAVWQSYGWGMGSYVISQPY